MYLLRKARPLDGRIDFNGLQISIETGRSRVRQWHDPHEDRSGMTRMQHPYGYVTGSLGQDGDAVDVYVGLHRDAPNVYIVNQMKAPDFTEHDEQKVMLGFKTKDEARKAYLRHYDNRKFMGSITTMPFEEFKEKVLATRENQGAIIKALTADPDHIRKSGEEMCKRIGDKLGVDWKKVDLDEFCDGMFEEEEHKDITCGDPVETAKIVLAHLKEDRHYYTKLANAMNKSTRSRSGIYLLRRR